MTVHMHATSPMREPSILHCDVLFFSPNSMINTSSQETQCYSEFQLCCNGFPIEIATSQFRLNQLKQPCECLSIHSEVVTEAVGS